MPVETETPIFHLTFELFDIAVLTLFPPRGIEVQFI